MLPTGGAASAGALRRLSWPGEVWEEGSGGVWEEALGQSRAGLTGQHTEFGCHFRCCGIHWAGA